MRCAAAALDVPVHLFRTHGSPLTLRPRPYLFAPIDGLGAEFGGRRSDRVADSIYFDFNAEETRLFAGAFVEPIKGSAMLGAK